MNGEVLRGGCRAEVTGQMAGQLTPNTAVVAEVSVAVSQWVEQVGRFLGVVQAALEQSLPREDATAEVRAVVGELPALLRQCRAQVPTPEMIRTWVQTLSETKGMTSDPEETDAPTPARPALAARFEA